MTEQEFADALDRWGPELAHWPPRPARQARALLATSRRARRALGAARAVDAWLATLEHPRPSRELPSRILAALPDRPPVERLSDGLPGWLQPPWRPALLAVAVAAAGFVVGLLGSAPPDAGLADQVTRLAFRDLYEEIDHAEP
jgi:hypothetical protein